MKEKDVSAKLSKLSKERDASLAEADSWKEKYDKLMKMYQTAADESNKLRKLIGNFSEAITREIDEIKPEGR